MSIIQTLRAFVNQRQAAAVEEIFVLLETTICNYEEEIGRQRRLLVDVVKPETNVSKADVLKLIVRKEGQQEWSSSVDRQDPESPHIKEEQEELCIIQDGEQPQGMEQADITNFPITPVIPVKSEDEDKLSPHSFIKDKLRRTERQSLQPEAQLNRWKQTLTVVSCCLCIAVS